MQQSLLRNVQFFSLTLLQNNENILGILEVLRAE